MKTLLGCLCFLIVTTHGEVCLTNEKECLFDNENWNIAIPENCTVDDYNCLTCPDFVVTLDTIEGHEHTEHRTKIKCSQNASPYKYLSKMKSIRNSLALEDCRLPEHESFGEGWPELEHLKFENQEPIGPLKREHFSGLNKLWYLELIIKSNHEMPDDLFADVPKLKEIVMIVEEANKNVFKNLNELETLRISIDSKEKLNDFDTSEMKNLPSLKTLELRGNSFTRLTKQFFVGCTNIENLEFYSNSFDAIDADAFESLKNLKRIDFSFNTMTLPEGLLSRNLKLERVEIAYNQNLKSLPTGFLSNLPNLREIEIIADLTSFPSHLIRGSINLELLDLQHNDLTSLPRNLIRDHSKLKIIKLFGNKFNSVDFDNMSPLTEVTF